MPGVKDNAEVQLPGSFARIRDSGFGGVTRKLDVLVLHGLVRVHTLNPELPKPCPASGTTLRLFCPLQCPSQYPTGVPRS